MHEYSGVIHCHSIFSDGSGHPAEIGAIAAEAGLDFLILTDHNTLRARKEGYERFYGNTLMLVGAELNDRENRNHYLAFGINEVFSTRLSAAEYVAKVNEAGGIGFLAHPHEKRDSMKEHPPYPWTDWSVTGFTGIEIWNHMSEWMENLTEENKYRSFVHPLSTISAPPAETLAIWDELNRTRKVVGIGGVDAHAHKVNVLGFLDVEVFPYKVLFKSIRTHILSVREIQVAESAEGVALAAAIVLKALKSGSCFVANTYCGSASGFRFFAETREKIVGMGEEISLCGELHLCVTLPGKRGVIALFRDGLRCEIAENSDARFLIDAPGSYRVEVYLNGKAWIFSNHIRVTENNLYNSNNQVDT